ncbi:MAG: hypothetical protein ACFFDK_09675 [Promethearchaeota archaeon]
MGNEYFWTIVKKYNSLMKSSIIGPNCIDPSICKGDCCSIKIDVPKVLAKEYIKRGYASEKDFIRSDIFTFQLRFDDNTGKCFLYDKKINGCKVHNSGIKPPQCWIYPTGFSNAEKEEISCKKASGWKIINPNNAIQAEKLLEKFNFLCQIEAKNEIRQINKRNGKAKSKNSKEKIKELKKKLTEIAPSQLGGFKDKWNFFDILLADGMSLQMKKFCSMHHNKCEYPRDNFFECKNICTIIADKLIEFLQDIIYEYIKSEGPDTYGEFPLIKLFGFVNNKKKSRIK